ncbi:MAG TPA: AbrB/MazE/SpoVT family DNA-binding domain-containing protein [Bacilli bacterium]|nr:AbrB/MazE/SpoVT family DNA-binding domain-containing protein [Bacilli bacterium]
MYINKKIDSLGRIVIPKEIRNKLHILDQENLDISLLDDQIVIKKSSDDIYNKHIFDSIIASIKKEISIDINIFSIGGIYYNKNSLILSEQELEQFIKKNETSFKDKNIFPIFYNGILYGGIIYSKNLSYEVEKVLLCFKSFLEKYLEQ